MLTQFAFPGAVQVISAARAFSDQKRGHVMDCIVWEIVSRVVEIIFHRSRIPDVKE